MIEGILDAPIGRQSPPEALACVWRITFHADPAAPKDLGFASAYVFGAVCPLAGKAAALIMPICNTVAMNHHLGEISSQVASDAHAVVILDGAGWHRSQGLVVPGNITLLAPPLAPEKSAPFSTARFILMPRRSSPEKSRRVRSTDDKSARWPW